MARAYVKILALLLLVGISFGIYPLTPELVQKDGYSMETHNVTTADGYILSLHRIPYGNKYPKTRYRPAVLLQHGIFSSSYTWLQLGPHNALGYYLADIGFDVWMSNSRGNSYSMGHRDNLQGDKYWDFSWHEMGVYDLPAVIDYILAETGRQKLLYMGHSMGATMFFVMASEKAEYVDKIEAMFALAPVVYESHMKVPLIQLLIYFQDIIKILLPSSIGIFPGIISTKTLSHFAQNARSGKFQNYNYGKVGNIAKYGRPSPPEYNLTKADMPVVLYYADRDRLANPEDVELLHKVLPNVITDYRISFERFNHLDFLKTEKAKALYDITVNHMRRYAAPNLVANILPPQLFAGAISVHKTQAP